MEFDYTNLMNNIESIQGNFSKPKYGDDERFWKISRNDQDQGTAVIRLVPSRLTKDGQETVIPFLKIYEYNIDFRQFGIKRFIAEETRSSLLKNGAEEKDAYVDLYKELKNRKDDKAQEISKCFRRSKRYISNIYIVNDPIAKNNTGKDKLWKFGAKLFDKFQAVANPSEEDIALGSQAIQLFDPIRGANVILKQKKSAGFYNYDDTQIQAPTPLLGMSDLEQVKSWLKENTIDLTEWVTDEHYKSYEEQVENIKRVLAGSEIEMYLRSYGSFIYKGETSSQPQTQNDGFSTGIETTQTNPVETPKVEEAIPSSTQAPTVDADDLSFLDEIGD